MLELGLVRRQINRMLEEEQQSAADYTVRLTTAVTELVRWDNDSWQQLAARIKDGRTSWLVAGFTGPLAERQAVGVAPRPLSVVCTDGSQIFPDRHEISNCYLLNVGRVALHYGTKERPHLSTRPILCYGDEDLYVSWGRRKTGMTPELIGIRRGALELEDLAGLGRDCRGMDPGRPVVALSDGTLILWTLEGKPDDFKQAMLDRYRQAFECLRSHTVPVAGYISDPRSSDVVNALRVGLCPAERVDCDRCPYSPADGLLPCEKVAGVTDAILFSRMLLPGERSQVFSSSSLVLDDYPPEQRISFCYINVGSEVARLEFPQWVADDGYLDLMAATALDQAQKGQGYPVVLTEAHERAVIRGPERESFYRLLEETMIQRGVKVAVSRKSLGKRSVFV